MKTDEMCSDCVFYNRKKKVCRRKEDIKSHADCIKILSGKIAWDKAIIDFLKYYSNDDIVDEYEKYYKEFMKEEEWK